MRIVEDLLVFSSYRDDYLNRMLGEILGLVTDLFLSALKKVLSIVDQVF